MKIALFIAAVAMGVVGATDAFAGSNRSSSSSASYSSSHSSSRANNYNNVSQNDRLQAPGFGVGGGYCSDGLSVSFPGGGFGFTSMVKVCKAEVGARVARQYLGAKAAAQYVCSQSDFRALTACAGNRPKAPRNYP